MQIDRSALDRLLSLDDVTLAKTINMLAAAAGVDKKSAKAATENIRLIRASLSNATDEDINRAVNIIGKDKAGTILDTLNGKNNG